MLTQNAIRCSVNTYPICGFRDQRGADLLRDRNGAKITVPMCQQRPALSGMISAPARKLFVIVWTWPYAIARKKGLLWVQLQFVSFYFTFKQSRHCYCKTVSVQKIETREIPERNQKWPLEQQLCPCNVTQNGKTKLPNSHNCFVQFYNFLFKAKKIEYIYYTFFSLVCKMLLHGVN